nr:hypothetical protein [Tanacetum cinerariifolium]
FQDKFDAEKAGEENDQQYVLFPMWSSGFTNPQNYDGDVAFDEKDHDAMKPESAINVSPSSSAQLGKQNDKTKKKAKGKSHVESSTRYRHLSAEFEDCSENSSNKVNAAAAILRKFRLTKGKSASTPIDTEKPLLKDPDGEDVDVHIYRKQTVVATSSTEAKYVAAASCCTQIFLLKLLMLEDFNTYL